MSYIWDYITFQTTMRNNQINFFLFFYIEFLTEKWEE